MFFVFPTICNFPPPAVARCCFLSTWLFRTLPMPLLYFSTVAGCIAGYLAKSSLILTVFPLLHDAVSGGCLLSYYRSLRTFATRTASHGRQNSAGVSPRLALSYTAALGGKHRQPPNFQSSHSKPAPTSHPLSYF